MEVMPGYKQTEVGVIPEDWGVVPIGQAGQVLGGRQRSPHALGEPTKYLRVANVFDGFIDTADVLKMPFTASERERFFLCVGDILLNEGQSLNLVGRSAVYRGDPPNCCFQNTLVRFRANAGIDTAFAQAVFQDYLRRGIFASIALQTTSIAHLGTVRLAALCMQLPPLPEQHAIAEALSDADALIESLEQLIAKKRHLKQGAILELLTRRKRLPGFSDEWASVQIAEIASPTSEKNIAAEKLPVLTCSKHLGFVDSLGYFKSQVFSNNTSTYKIIRRGQIGYPANHVEEGSIGLQNLYDVALVSPIYVVFSVRDGINSEFLHKVLKQDSYRQRFKTATTSSVDRRGSLRWPAFSAITVNLPTAEEQTAIAAILSDMDAEIAALEAMLAKYRQIKQGMMHNLLTGRIRLL